MQVFNDQITKATSTPAAPSLSGRSQRIISKFTSYFAPPYVVSDANKHLHNKSLRPLHTTVPKIWSMRFSYRITTIRHT